MFYFFSYVSAFVTNCLSTTSLSSLKWGTAGNLWWPLFQGQALSPTSFTVSEYNRALGTKNEQVDVVNVKLSKSQTRPGWRGASRHRRPSGFSADPALIRREVEPERESGSPQAARCREAPAANPLFGTEETAEQVSPCAKLITHPKHSCSDQTQQGCDLKPWCVWLLQKCSAVCKITTSVPDCIHW